MKRFSNCNSVHYFSSRIRSHSLGSPHRSVRSKEGARGSFSHLPPHLRASPPMRSCTFADPLGYTLSPYLWYHCTTGAAESPIRIRLFCWQTPPSTLCKIPSSCGGHWGGVPGAGKRRKESFERQKTYGGGGGVYPPLVPMRRRERGWADPPQVRRGGGGGPPLLPLHNIS